MHWEVNASDIQYLKSIRCKVLGIVKGKVVSHSIGSLGGNMASYFILLRGAGLRYPRMTSSRSAMVIDWSLISCLFKWSAVHLGGGEGWTHYIANGQLPREP